MKYFLGIIVIFLCLSINVLNCYGCKTDVCDCKSKAKPAIGTRPAVRRCGCRYPTPVTAPPLPPAPLANFEQSISNFAINLYREVAKTADAGSDIILSPFSAQTILSLIMQGAGGQTLVELINGLQFDGSSGQVARSYNNLLTSLQQNSLINIANKAYFQTGYSLNPTFNEIASRDFYSSAEIINFSENVQAANTINSWVESQTNNLIKNLISPSSLNSLTRAVLVNTIYFKGLWTKQFQRFATYAEPFYSSGLSAPVDIDFMHKTDFYNYAELPSLNAKAVELKYRDSDISMVFVLPNDVDGLQTLESNLQNFNLQNIAPQFTNERVVLTLPKFKSSFSITLNQALSNLGMPTMFSDSADFSGLLASNIPLQITSVVQKAFIEVNEEGAEAAAATGIVVGTTSVPVYEDPPKEFKADHPFIYYIRDAAGFPYFIGRFENNSA